MSELVAHISTAAGVKRDVADAADAGAVGDRAGSKLSPRW